MTINFLQSLGSGNYGTVEGVPNQNNQDVINSFQQIINTTQKDANGNSLAWNQDKKNTVIGLLQQIEDIISQNRTATQQQLDALSQSESVIKKEISDLNDSNTILSDLQAQKIDSNVQNVANDEYSEYYLQISEYNYRLSIISQNKQDVKEILLQYDNDMLIVQNYITALQS